MTVELRKLYLDVFTSLADISLGRQIINFGVGTLFSPIDAFTVPLLSDLNYVRTGSDVVRLDAQFNDVSGLEAVSTIAGSFSALTSALKLYSNVFDFDIAGVGMYRGARNEVLAGAYFKGDIELGVYGEAVEHFMYSPVVDVLRRDARGGLLHREDLLFHAGVLLQRQPGGPRLLGPLDLANAPALFLNQHYLYFMARWQLTDLAGPFRQASSGTSPRRGPPYAPAHVQRCAEREPRGLRPILQRGHQERRRVARPRLPIRRGSAGQFLRRFAPPNEYSRSGRQSSL